MQNTQLQEVLQKFGKKDIKSFTEYLRSPYFNKKNTLIQFWDALQKYAPQFSIEEDDKIKIGEQISGKQYHDAYYRNLCSDLLESVLHYLAQEKFNNSETEVLLMKNRVLLELRLLTLLEKNIKQTEKSLQKYEQSYTNILQFIIQIDDFKTHLLIRKHRNKIELIRDSMLNTNATKYVMDYTLWKSFLYIINDYRARKMLKKSPNYELATHYFSMYENGLSTQSQFIKAYYLATKLIFSKDEKYYFELKEILFKNKLELPLAIQTNLLNAMIEYLLAPVESGESRWLLEMFEIYDYRIKNNLWKEHADLSYAAFINVIQLAVMLGKIEYAEEKIKILAPQINITLRDHVTSLCYAWLFFYKGDFEKAHQFLLPIETENIAIKFSLRNLQAMIYFETGDYLTLASYIDSFKHFIKYNTELLDAAIKNSGLTFCKLLNQLNKLKQDPNKNHSEKLQKEIGESACLMKTWLLQKV